MAGSRRGLRLPFLHHAPNAPATTTPASGAPGLARLNPITWLGLGSARPAPADGQEPAGTAAGSATATAVLDPGAPAAGDRVAATRGYSRWRVAFFMLAAFGLIAAVAWALLDSRFLVVRSVDVTGAHLVPKSDIIAAADVPKGLPLIRVNTTTVASRVDRITQIQSVHVTRDWPDTLVITVQERHAALAIPDAGRFYLVDPSGVIVQRVSKRPAGLPLFTPVGPAPGNPGIRAAADVMRSLPRDLARQVKSVTVPDLDAVTLHLSSGITVNWGSVGGTPQKAHELSILMGTHARYYDVSAPGSAATSG
ncbi:MAG TPA: FtsQ-type POTRA domain-containing protein [Streptosporangiaceae bacterium]